jgi:hypothetical protein
MTKTVVEGRNVVNQEGVTKQRKEVTWLMLTAGEGVIVPSPTTKLIFVLY